MLKQHFRRYSSLLAVALVLLAIVSQVVPQQKASAAFTPRKLTLVNGGTDGGSEPSGVVGHSFDWTFSAAVNTRSIRFLYCTTPVATQTCTPPTGLNTGSAALGTIAPGGTGFSIFSQNANTIILTRAAAANFSGAITVPFTNITNPSAVNTTFYVRISAHASADATGAVGDSGSVAASTADPIVLNGTMPESLVFCTGFGVVANCSTTTSQIAVFDDLFSPTVTRWTKAEMAASTNAAFGYSITMWGATLSNGTQSIAAMGSQAASAPGTPQFGSNLMQNTAVGSFTSGIAATFNGGGTLTNTAGSPNITGTGTTFLSSIAVGDLINFTSGTAETCTVQTVTSNTAIVCAANITAAHTTDTFSVTYASGANFGANTNPAANSPTTVPLLRGVPHADYDDANMFKFSSGDVVAASNQGGTDSPSDAQKYTMSYIVNVPGSQAAGLYSTTLTYICTATF
jgi:hypothetical protein